MVTRSALIDQLPENYQDAKWLDDNIDTLYKGISRRLDKAEFLHSSVENLLLMMPVVSLRTDVSRWGLLLRKALENLDEAGEIKPTMYAVLRREKPRRPTRTNRRRRERIESREMFELYLMLTMAVLYHKADSLTADQVSNMMKFARIVNEPYLNHKLYQTLAFMYNRRYAFEQALDYGRLAFEYWQTQDMDDPAIRFEAAMTAFVMSCAYQGQKDFKTALDWLDFAAENFAKEDHPLQYCIVAGQIGSIKINAQEYDVAEQWLRMAVEECDNTDSLIHTTISRHYLGMALGYQGQLDEAYEILVDVVAIWELEGQTSYQVHSEHTLAFVEAQLGRQKSALDRIQRCIEILESLPESDVSHHRIEKFTRLRSAIEDGKDLNTLSPEN